MKLRVLKGGKPSQARMAHRLPSRGHGPLELLLRECSELAAFIRKVFTDAGLGERGFFVNPRFRRPSHAGQSTAAGPAEGMREGPRNRGAYE